MARAAASVGMIGGGNCVSGSPPSSTPSWFKINKCTGRERVRVVCSASSSSYPYVNGGRKMDPYRTLGIQRGASEYEIKTAFRKLAKKYHPDVCRGGNCSVEFSQINQAYDMVMTNMREEEAERAAASYDEPDSWDDYMGFEGGFVSYASHYSPYTTYS
ncbi:hypothetical protein Tsubulata_017307 [Turnera subulata]|uniref:J domain-containing protein n=1 Tax=Turnera subulata TaxID=218843 RepID=A0A9Q0IYZ3_9ROSI|nr:hypothetical protein Tsubulata_017307 [Turnera subulata]